MRKQQTGSMWVWIPRYSYSITYAYAWWASNGGEIEVEFMKGLTNVSSSGRTNFQNASGENNWNIHPAFNYGREVAGIWVAKFEASSSTNGSFKIVPNVPCWYSGLGYQSLGDVYTICLNYNSSLNSHLIKNVEWGAALYLAQSIYGKNSEIWNNPSFSTTGMAGSSAKAPDNSSEYRYETANGQQASTTGNIYGIYDMNGGSWEYTAAFIDNFYTQTNGENDYITKVLKAGPSYSYEVYAIGRYADNPTENSSENRDKYGDAIYETSQGGSSEDRAWYDGKTYFPSTNNSFFVRGDYTGNENASAFSYTMATGRMGHAFRPVLIVY